MAKYLDENGLKTLISNIKTDIEKTAWQDSDGNINTNFKNQITQIIQDNLTAAGITNKINISDINSDLVKTLNLVFNRGNRQAIPTGFSTEQKVIKSGLIFEHTNNKTYDFSDNKSGKTSAEGTILVVTKDIKLYFSKDLYSFNGDIYAYNIEETNAGYLLYVLSKNTDYGYYSVTADISFDKNTQLYTIKSSEISDADFTLIKTPSIIPAGLYIVMYEGSVLNILTGKQYTISKSKNQSADIEISKVMSDFISVQVSDLIDDILKEIESKYDKLDFDELEFKAKFDDKLLETFEIGDNDSLILESFADPYDKKEGKYPVIEFISDYNNIIKFHIKGSKIFGDIKLIPIDDSQVLNESENGDYYSKHCTGDEMEYCMVYTGRGNLSSITQTDNDGIRHVVKISADDNTKVKTSSLYPIALSKHNKRGNIILFTLNSLNENLHIEN